MTTPHSNTNEPEEALGELRDLLLLPEQHRLEDLETRFMEPDILAGYMKEALPTAVRLSAKTNTALIGSMQPLVEVILDKSVRQNPNMMIEVLSPVIGQAVRKSVKETMERTIQAINLTMETSLTWRSLKWRFEAWRTGKTFSEIVIYNTLIYRVEQVFLIDKATGVLLCHCSSDLKAMGDSDLVGAMLTAISDFVKDSFTVSQDSPLQSMRVGELDVWIETGTHAYLALVIRGNVPLTLRKVMTRALEDIHDQYTDALKNFNGDNEPFRSCYGILAQCMRSRRKEPSTPKGAIYFTLLLLAASCFWFGTGWLERTLGKDTLKQAFQDRPGIVIYDLEPIEGGFRGLGLRDPLAPELEVLARSYGYSGVIEDGTRPFYSLEAAMLLKRTRKQLSPIPEGVTVSIRAGNVVVVSGEAPLTFVRETVRSKLPLGVAQIDTSNLFPMGQQPVAKKEAVAPIPVAPPASSALPETLPDMVEWLSLKNLTFSFKDDPLEDAEKNVLKQVAKVIKSAKLEARKEQKILNIYVQAMVPKNDMGMKVQGYSRAMIVKQELESLGVERAYIELRSVIFNEVVAETAEDQGVIIFGVSLSSESRPE